MITGFTLRRIAGTASVSYPNRPEFHRHPRHPLKAPQCKYVARHPTRAISPRRMSPSVRSKWDLAHNSAARFPPARPRPQVTLLWRMPSACQNRKFLARQPAAIGSRRRISFERPHLPTVACEVDKTFPPSTATLLRQGVGDWK